MSSILPWVFPVLSRQKLFNGEIPAALIRQHRTDEFIKVIRQLADGVF